MKRSKYSKSRKSHSKEKEEDISDIIPMSNDDSINQKKKKSKHSNNINDEDDEQYDTEETDDEVNSDDEQYDTEETDDEQYERKGKNHNDDEFDVPNIKPKRSRPHRSSKFAEQELSELKRDKGVKQLSDKLNNNLHQIQIAIPYGQQDPQRIPSLNGVNNNYQLVGSDIKQKKKLPFWKRRWFNIMLKVIICLCVFVVCGVFVYKYLKAIEELKRRNNDIFADDQKKHIADEYDDTKTEDILTDKTYDSLGNVSAIKGGVKNKGKRPLPQRDAKGRFIKSK